MLNKINAAGLHIAFAGTDGSGKSSQAGRLTKALNDEGLQAYLCESKEEFAVRTLTTVAAAHGTCSPREYFGNEAVDVSKALDTLRDRIMLIQPLCQRGAIAVVPRSSYCRIALAKAMGNGDTAKLEAIVTASGEADVTLFLDVPPAVAHARIERRGIDSEDLSMLTAFHGELSRLADRDSLVRIDGTASPDEIAGEVRRSIQPYLDEPGHRFVRRPL